jgi:hypothetical protein
MNSLLKELPEAVFLGFQETITGSKVPLFNIVKKGHPRFGSTVSIPTLIKEGLKIPKIPEGAK